MALAVAKQNASWRIVDGEAVVIHLQTTHYYSLNGSGTYVWELLAEQPLDPPAIVVAVARHYDRPEAEVADAVHTLLRELIREQLVEER